MEKTAVIAIGGNSLIKDKDHVEIHHQMQAVDETVKSLISIIEAGYNLVITHGNGPQVGFGLMRSEMAKGVAPLVPLAVCGAETQGFIGYMIQQRMINRLQENNSRKDVATVVTQVEVDAEDEAFNNPTKPIGPFYTAEEVEEKKDMGWQLVEDSGRGFRRVVPSPLPKRIVELGVIKKLVESGLVVIAAGGGGIPVVTNQKGELEGIAAVIDKDHASSFLARGIKADLFVISTAVEKVYINFNTPEQEGLDRITLSEARKYLQEGHFAAGSMKPKIEAAINFLENGGQEVLITSPEFLADAIEGKTGTRITRDK